ncbi:MAG: ABC transporter ATP-binding protein [Candidatus Latescibacterota bacterium]|nr:MAG: ABC transporter ATP-binding protein [Candidatus Latescibacterota bacterium]
MLRLINIEAYYDSLQALHGVSLHVGEGEIVALIGANGAGKTTLLNTIAGLLPTPYGRILFYNQDISTLTTPKRVSLGISLVPEGRDLFSDMSVEENLLLGADGMRKRLSPTSVEEKFQMVFQLFPVLFDRRGQIARTLSGGEQQMLAIARALMGSPKLLLLDEPSTGLAPMLVREMFHKIAELKRAGTTILLAEQNVKMALNLADRGYVLETGRIVLQGTRAELLANRRVQQAYLGRD